MITCFIDRVLALKDFVCQYLNVTILQICLDIGHGVVYQICVLIADVRKVCLLNCGENMMDEGLLCSCHFTEDMHCFGVSDAHVQVHVGGGAVHNNEWTLVSWADKGCV